MLTYETLKTLSRDKLETEIGKLGYDETLTLLNQGREIQLSPNYESTEDELYGCILLTRRLRSLRVDSKSKTTKTKAPATKAIADLGSLFD